MDFYIIAHNSEDRKEDINMDEIETLRRLADELEEKRNRQYLGKKLLGFTLTRGKNGNGILQWRAYTYYKGKKASVYVGKDPRKAEEKIRKWVTNNKHFLPLIG